MPSFTDPTAAGEHIGKTLAGTLTLSPGNFTKYTVVYGYDDESKTLMIGVQTMGCYGFSNRPGILHESYVAEKLKCSLGDALPIVDMIDTANETRLEVMKKDDI